MFHVFSHLFQNINCVDIIASLLLITLTISLMAKCAIKSEFLINLNKIISKINSNKMEGKRAVCKRAIKKGGDNLTSNKIKATKQNWEGNQRQQKKG